MALAFRLVIVLFFTAPPVIAQQVQPDTLDWHGYYPLELGTIREWHDDEGSFSSIHTRQDIIADTLVDGHRWAIQVEIQIGWEFGDSLMTIDTLLLRYDDPHGRVLARSPRTGEEWDYTCDLSGDFGAETRCNVGMDHEGGYLFSGGYASHPYHDFGPLVVGSDTVLYAAVKFNPIIIGPVPPWYYHGVGRLPQPGDGHGGYIAFTYLRLDEVEYGTAVVRVSTEQDQPLPEASIEVYPNPTRGALTVAFGQGTMEMQLYDIWGRLVMTRQACSAPCRLRLGDLPRGTYIIDVRRADGGTAWRRIVLVP